MPGIHPSRKNIFEKEMDCRVKPGNDERCFEIGLLKNKSNGATP
jgi:hypothetical protein